MKKSKHISPSPTDLRQTILKLLASSDRPLTKNQIARQISVRGDERIVLKQLLADLEAEGKLDRGARRRITIIDRPLASGHVLMAEITSVGEDGELLATPLEWTAEAPPPQIEVLPSRRTHPHHSILSIGTHVLVRLHTPIKDQWRGEILKKLEKTPHVHVGLFTPSRDGGGRLSSCHRKDTFPGARLTPFEAKDLQEGDVVVYSVSAAHGPKILKKLGPIHHPHTFSPMAIYAHRLPHIFSPEAITLSQQGTIPDLGGRTDFRSIPLVTIDGDDARDFDDAVWAAPDTDSRNPDGWRLLVAIADVAYYVRPGDALDHAAKERGNSVYFPDQVIPMLPEALSTDLCSLKPHVDRACLAIEMIISHEGKVKSHHIKRGLMCSQARLTYAQVQAAMDGYPDDITQPLMEKVIKPLYGAYQSLLKARNQRGTLNIEQIERQVIFSKDGHIQQIIPRPHYESHRLIEEFMIAANVAAARTLSAKGWPCLYRIHDTPDALRLANLRQTLRKMKIPFTKTTKPHPSHFNELLEKTRRTPSGPMISELVLRSQAQARYNPLNIGHFGLSLSQYAHFTSPIRRYADLIVHRSLISALDLGPGGLPDKSIHLTTVAEHISTTERQAALAERDALERFITAYHAPHVGETFLATIVGITKIGLFVAITDTGAQGFIPRSSLKGDTFYHEEDAHRLIGRRSKITYQLGNHLEVRLQSADITANSLIFEVAADDPYQQKKVKPYENKKRSKISKQKKNLRKHQ